MPKYIHQLEKWPDFNWNNEVIVPILSNLRYKQAYEGLQSFIDQ